MQSHRVAGWGSKPVWVSLTLYFIILFKFTELYSPPCTGHPHHAPDEGLVQVIDGNGVREVGGESFQVVVTVL